MKFTQINWPILLILALLAGLIGGLMTAFGAFPLPVFGLLMALLGTVAFLSWKVIISVDSHAVRISFGTGLIRYTWPTASIATVQPVRNSGWQGGIQIGPTYMIYGATGRDAVELTFHNGWPVRLITDQPAALTAAIAAHLPRP